jgi:hypothetical protein
LSAARQKTLVALASERKGELWVVPDFEMVTQGVHLIGVLPLAFVRWADTRDFCPPWLL